MARLDLVGANVETFEMHADFSMNAEQLESLLGDYGAAFRENDLPVIFVDHYQRHKQQHGAVAFIRAFEGGGDTYHLDLTYRVAPGLPRASHIWKVSRFFEIFQPVLGTLEFSVRTAFSYPSMNFASRLRLPVKLAPSADSIFDEIRGMRVRKYAEDENVKYDAVIDLGTEVNRLYQHITFAFVGTLATDTVSAAFESAKDISEHFVVPIGG